ncbi:MAG: hypothetical protein KDC24_00655 [Saprospiraceae bacterium]|nr:hypothetical protein [Saprospiraceae bacterium]
MKKLMTLFIFIGIVSQFSCDKCRNVDCFTPPPTLLFKIQDATTGLDYLKSNAIAPESVAIFSVSEMVTHKLESFDQDSIFQFRDIEIGWETGVNRIDYELRIDTLVIPFQFHTENVSEDCCAFFRIEDVPANDQAIFQSGINQITFKINL